LKKDDDDSLASRLCYRAYLRGVLHGRLHGPQQAHTPQGIVELIMRRVEEPGAYGKGKGKGKDKGDSSGDESPSKRGRFGPHEQDDPRTPGSGE
jgi:hypothetical protein